MHNAHNLVLHPSNMDSCCCSVKYGSLLNLNHYTLFEDLPDGLVFEILSRLPFKTLLQSICVCKLWCFIVKTPCFISAYAHLSRSISNPCSYYIFLSHRETPSVTVISYYPLIIRRPHFSFPFQTQSTNLEFIGACNGLICVTDSNPKYRGRDIYVTNPFIHKYNKLGVESSCYSDLIVEKETIRIYIGFGYCEFDDDYKVLRIIQHRADTRISVNAYKVEVYSLKHGKWRALDSSVATELAPAISPTRLHSCTFVHGCLYWHAVCVNFAANANIQEHDEYLLCFDLKHELFSKIEFPETYFELDSTWELCVTVKSDSLAIVLFTEDNTLSSTWICLCVLEKRSGGQIKWEEFNHKVANFYPKECIGLFGGGRLIFVTYSGLQRQHIVAVDLDNSCAIERLTLSLEGANDYINGAINVSESLVLLSD